MADHNNQLPAARGKTAVGGAEPRSFSATSARSGSKRLQVEPMAVLLPVAGSVHALHEMREELAERLRVLQEQKAISSEYDVRAQAAEESMLQQALQWLAAGREE